MFYDAFAAKEFLAARAAADSLPLGVEETALLG
jgi:hypothetical protein